MIADYNVTTEQKPKAIQKSIIFNGKIYIYRGETRKNINSSISCPFCEKEIVVPIATKRGEISRRSRRFYELKNGSRLFMTILDKLNNRLISEALDEIISENSCSFCPQKFASDCNEMDEFIFKE